MGFIDQLMMHYSGRVLIQIFKGKKKPKTKLDLFIQHHKHPYVSIAYHGVGLFV